MRVPKTRPVHQLIEEQVARWRATSEQQKKELPVSVITISREPGSLGHLVGQRLAEDLAFDLFDREIIHAVAESSQARESLIATLDERGRSSLNDIISSLENRHHIWTYEYLHHLINVIGTIGRHGCAVIIGRGANFILPRQGTFRVRIIAPMELRIRNISKEMNISQEEARNFIIKTDSDRKAFIRKYFNAEIENPQHYDMVINTEIISVDAAVECIKTASGLKQQAGLTSPRCALKDTGEQSS